MATDDDPGAATAFEIAIHWGVCEDTSRRVLAASGLPPLPNGPLRYRWVDIWRFEGEIYVPSHASAAFKAPLLVTENLVDDSRRGRSDRSIRRKMESGKIPSIMIGNQRRVRQAVAERILGYI